MHLATSAQAVTLFPRIGRGPSATDNEAIEARRRVWEQALAARQLPSFVIERLGAAGAGRAPWTTTLTPAALLLAKSHGMTPVATVSGSCCYQYGWSWTDAQPSGWALAQDRLRAEAIACGANAVLDVKMSIRPSGAAAAMDFSLTGTAVRLRKPLPGPGIAVATVSALEFVRLLERGIVPIGLVIGSRYGRYFDQSAIATAAAQGRRLGAPTVNRDLSKVGQFWTDLRRGAHRDLQQRAVGLGTGVLAHVHWSQLEGAPDDNTYFGRHVVIGTVIKAQRGDRLPTPVQTVMDMCEGPSPLLTGNSMDPNLYVDRAERGANE